MNLEPTDFRFRTVLPNLDFTEEPQPPSSQQATKEKMEALVMKMKQQIHSNAEELDKCHATSPTQEVKEETLHFLLSSQFQQMVKQAHGSEEEDFKHNLSKLFPEKFLSLPQTIVLTPEQRAFHVAYEAMCIEVVCSYVRECIRSTAFMMADLIDNSIRFKRVLVCLLQLKLLNALPTLAKEVEQYKEGLSAKLRAFNHMEEEKSIGIPETPFITIHYMQTMHDCLYGSSMK